MSWKDRVKANEESGENEKIRAEAAGMLSGAMKQHLVTSGEYKDQAQMGQFNRYISEYNDIVQKFGSSGLDISGQNDFIKSFKGISDEMSNNYSQFKNRAEFDSAKKAQSDYEGMLSYDTKSGRAELDQLKKHLEKAKSLAPAGYSTKEGANRTVNPNTKPLSNYLKSIGYSSIDELEKDVAQKQQYINLSERAQNRAKLESDATSDKEFSQYAAQGAAIKNPTVSEATPDVQIFGKDIGGKEVKNKVSYVRDNYNDIYGKYSANVITSGGGYRADGFNPDYMQMTDDEVNIYNYYLAKFGSDKADEYLDSITESLRYRTASESFNRKEGKTAQELAFNIAAGLDQFNSGIESLLNDKEYITPSAISMQSGMIREDLADVGPQVLGSSIGQGLYDLGTTGANMLPSIAVSSIIGLVNKGAGAAVGSALLGTSAAGNAYAEMLNLGYTEEQARTYGYITGALEGGLQYLLGGISKLGGKVTGEALGKAIEGINNGAAKFAIKFGGEMASEGLEESLQEIISPMLKNAIFNTEDKVDWEQVAYSGLLGALSAGMFNSADAVTNTIRENNEYRSIYGTSAEDLIASGMESAEGTKSRQLAEQFAKELAGGKQLSGKQLKQLVSANDEAIKAENAQNSLPTNVSEAGILSEGKVLPKTEIGAEGTTEAVSDADIIRDSIADMKVNKATADAIVNGFDAADGVSVEDYVLGVKEAYKYGSVGMKAEYIAKEGFASNLTDAQMKLAYNLGKTDAKYATVKAQEAIDLKVSKANALPTNKGKIVYHLDRELSVDDLKPIQRASIKYAEAVAAVVGNNVNVFESVVDKNGNRVFSTDVGQFKAGAKAPNGFYDTKTGQVYIDLNAGNSGSGTMLYTLGHEYTHFIRQNAPAKFKALADFLMEEFSDKGVPAKTLIHNQIQKAKKAGRDIDFDTAYEEVVADAMESMLTDTNVAEKIQKLKQTDKTLWQKLKDMISKLFKQIQNIYKDLNPESLEANYVREMKDSIEKLSDLFAEGLAAAGEAYQSIGSIAGVSMEYSVNDAMTGADISDITKKPLTKLQERTEYERLPKEMIKITASGAVRSPMAITINGKTFNKTESVRELRNARFKENGFKTSDVIKINDFLDKMRGYLKDARLKYNYVGLQDVYDAKIIISPTTDSIVLSAMVNNGDYEINFDFTKTCKKRISIQEVIEQLAREKGKLNDDGTTTEVDLSEENLRHINEVLAANGIETACLCCFVESKRYAMQSHYQEKVCDVWNALVDEVNAEEGNEKPAPYFNFADSDVETSKIPDEEFDKLYAELSRWRNTELEDAEEGEGAVKRKMKAFLQNTPSARKKLRLSDFVTEAGRTNLHKLYPDVESLAKAKIGTAIPKTVETFAPYNGEIELLSVTDTDGIEAHVAKIAGVRSQSFSDFIMSHVYDVLQKTASLTARKLSARTYTKEISRARLFGQTGEKHNMSVLHEVDPDVDSWHAGLRDDGSYFVSDYDAFSKGECHQIQSIPDTESIALQNTEGYSRDCGRIGVGFSYFHMLKMHNDPDIRQVIGYHTSSLPAILKPMTNLDKAADYTPVQNTLYFKGFKAPNYDLPEGVPSYATPPQDVKPRFKTTKSGKQSKERLPKYSKSNASFDIQGRYKELSKTMDGAAAAKETLRELLQFADDNGLFFMTSKYKNGHADFDLYGDVERTQNPYVTADNYIEYCISQGMLPMFYEFALNDNYYKDLWDFNAFDRLSYNPETGLHEDTPERKAYAPQLPVHMINEDGTMAFPDDFWELVDKYMKDYNYQREDFTKKFPKIMKEVRAIKDSQGVPMIRNSSERADDGIKYLVRVTDEDMLAKLNQAEREGVKTFSEITKDSNKGVVKVYRAMQAQPVDANGAVIPNASVQRIVSYDPLVVEAKVFKTVGRKKQSETITAPAKLFSPMAGQSEKGVWRNPINLNEWEMSEGRFEKGYPIDAETGEALTHDGLRKDGSNGIPKKDNVKGNASYGEIAYYYGLEKGGVDDNGNALTPVPARYNPYIHTSLSALNDQFSSGNKRPELVTVETLVPVFHINSGERLEGAKDRVGAMKWHSGPTSSRLDKIGKSRVVILSRYDKPVRVVPDNEVAASIAKTIGDSKNISIQESTVTPSLARELKALGVSVLGTEEWAKYAADNPVKTFGKKPKNNTKFSDRDSEYLELAKNPEQNKEKLQAMVDEAAKAAGYDTTRYYHGTSERFTSFDIRKSNKINDFGQAIYLTNDLANAQGYSGKNGIFNADLMNNLDAYAAGIADGQYDFETEYSEWVDAYNNAWDERAKQIEESGHVLELYSKMEKPFVVAEDVQISVEEAKKIAAGDKDLLHYIEFLASGKDHISTALLANNSSAIGLPAALRKAGYDGIEDRTVNEKFRLFKGTIHRIVFDATNVKSADPITYDDNGNIIPLSERFNAGNDDIRYSDRDSGSHSSDDEAYMDAYLNGDDDKMQEILDKVADRHGYRYKAYHHTENRFTKFDLNRARKTSDIQGFYFSADPEAESEYGSVRYDTYLKMQNPYIVDSKESARAIPLDRSKDNAGVIARQWLLDNGYDSVIRKAEYYGAEADEYIVLNANQIKSADVATYNDEYGEDIIPLSKRFNEGDDDIRYSDRDSLPENAEDIAKDYFGITDKWSETGWIVTDGTQLDFSGRHWEKYDDEIDLGESYYSNKRNAEHYEILDAFTDTASSTMADRGRALDLFLSRGNIRVDAKYGIAELGDIEPTEQQYEKLYKFFASCSKNGVVVVGYDRHGKDYGETFREGTSPASIVDSIRKFFRTNASAQSDLMRFHTASDDMYFSDRDSSSLDNRTILANAMETAAQNDVEKKYVDDYRKNIDKLNAEEQKLGELRAEIKKLSFAKGPRDTTKLKSLQDEATKTANRINVYDKKLLKLEAAKPLKDVIERERSKARKAQIEKGKESLERSRERSSKTVMRNKIKKVVKELDNYLRKGTKDKHVMEGLRGAVAEALEAVNMDTTDAESRVAKYDAKIAQATDPDVIAALTETRNRIAAQGDMMAAKLANLKAAYDEIKSSSDPSLANAYDEVISNSIEAVRNEVGNTPLRNMSLSQLEEVYKLYKMILTTVRNSNKAFKAAKAASIESIASRVMAELDSLSKKSKLVSKARDLAEKFGWNNLKPVYAFKAMGSGTFAEMFNNIRSGEDVWARDIAEAKEFFSKAAKDYGIDRWNMRQTFKFTASSGKTFELNLQQIMSLYAFSKRAQARDHIRKGGIVIDERTELKKGLRTFTIDDANAYNISDETLNEIIGKLSAEQRDYVDLMQSYLSTTMGGKGNEVSMEMYGVKLFTEKNYFPLKSAAQYMPKAKEQQQAETKIKNAGFTKETVQHANNPIVLSEFNDVWTGHVDQMSRYHAFTLPLEDFYRVYNYRTSTDEERATESITAAIEDVNGKGATQYIDQLLRDLNGGTRADTTTGVVNKGLSLFKKGAVMGSLSVVIQQPSAIARALPYIELKYFVGPKVKFSDKAWDEVKKYAPIAIIKEMGGYDTHVGQSTKDYITGEKGNILNKFDDLLGKAPELADQVTWCAIWQAAKRKAKAESGLSGEALLTRAGEIFTETIVNTQVYDSVISRSAMMRSKDGLMKMATAFMAEPTTSINMIADARIDWRNGAKKSALRKINSVITSVILNSALVSIVYAMRDDDDDETFAEKYISSAISKTMDGLNPLTYIPFIKDIYSEIQGYTTKRTDLAVFSDLIKAIQNFNKAIQKNEDILNPSIDLANQVLMIFGIPSKNITRDVRAFINTYGVAVNGEESTAAGLWYSVWEGLTEGSLIAKGVMGEKPSNKEQLYNAVSEGDTEHEQRVRGRYADEEKANSAFAQAVIDSYNSGNITKQQAVDLLVRKGGMDQDAAEKKVFNAEFKAKYGFSFNEKDEAYADGRITRNELIVILMGSGKTREEAETQVTVYDWQNEGYDIESNQSYIIDKFNEFCVPAGIDRQTYMNYRSATVSIKGERKEKVMDIIDSMSLTAAQKDALYYLEGWAASKIYEAPWH